MTTDRWLSRVPRRERRAAPPPAAGEQAPSPGEDGVPVVPYVPIRCPRCGERKPTTDGVHDVRDGRTRYHLCKGCDLKFRSVEIETG